MQPSLARFVQDVRIYSPGRVRRIQALPDGTVSLLFRVLGSGRGDLSVAGPRTRALFKTAPAIPACVVVRFKPGGANPILGVSACELVDRYVAIEDLWGAAGKTLVEKLLATTLNRAIDVLIAALAERVSSEQSSVTLARRALAHWHRDQALRVDDVATTLGVTARHLRRAFVESVGVGPKHYARMVRLQRAIGAASSRDWTTAALDAGYYDHAHLIADFHDLVGTTPTAFVASGRAPDVLFKPCVFA